MDPIYHQEFTVTDNCIDCFGRLKPSQILYYMQEVAGKHFDNISMDYDTLAEKGMMWAIIRQKVQVTRVPLRGETIRVETWPMPNTRVAFPRSVVAYDEAGNEVFRSISIWVLMDTKTRAMILPGKSGIMVPGTIRGNELAAPNALPARDLRNHRTRPVCFTDLDRNGHMNNTKYLDWIADLIPSSLHKSHEIKELTVCYMSEAREGQMLDLQWDFLEEGCLQVDAHRNLGDKDERIFSARILFE